MYVVIKWIVVLFILAYGVQSPRAQVTINEVMSSNMDFIFDEDGDDSDWLELHNPSQGIVCLDGWALTDDNDLEEIWPLPNVCLPAGEFLVIWASGKNRAERSDRLHTDFKLSAFGEDIFLINENGAIEDSIVLPFLEPNESFGRDDNSATPVVFTNPTPGFANDTGSIKTLTTFNIEAPYRVFNDEVAIKISRDGNCTEWLYNTRGVPYSGEALDLKQDTNAVVIEIVDHAPYFSVIPTTKDFRLPKTVEKMPHLAVSCIDEDIELGTYSSTFFTQHQIDLHELPIVNVDVKERDLFDSRIGILVEGENGNFRNEGRKWERPGEACLLQNDQLFCEYFGIRVHGHASRELPQKSLKLYDRSSSDTSILDRDLIFDEVGPLSRFVLRSLHSDHIGNEFTDFGFRDDIIMSIIRNENQVFAQSSKPVVGYINGEYWGIYSLHDASDDDFIAVKTGLHPDSIELFSGPEALYQKSRIVTGLDLDLPSERALFEHHFNLENLVDYLLYQLFFLNTDWPHNNIKFWKKKGSTGPHYFVLFDMDATMKSVRQNYFSRFYSGLGLSQRLDPKYNQFWQHLLSSSHFIDLLKVRYSELRLDILSTKRMLTKIEDWKQSVESEIDRHIDRWHYPRSKKAWISSYEEIKEFIAFRDFYFSRQLDQLVGSVLYPNPVVGSELFIRQDFVNAYAEARIYSLNGQLLKTTPIQNAKIDLSGLNLTSQCIFIDLIGSDQVRTEKVIWHR